MYKTILIRLILIIFLRNLYSQTLPAPSLISPSCGSSHSSPPTLQWSQVNGNAGYYVQVINQSNQEVCGQLVGLNTTSWTVPSSCFNSWATNTTYYWRVRTRSASGTYGPYSTNCEIKRITININMSVTPTSINFGNVNVGQSASQTLTISNQLSSNANLNITAGANLTSPFSISPQGSFSLTPGQSKPFTVTFSPTTAGSFNQNLQIAHNATNQTNPFFVPLSRTGVAQTPMISITPTSKDFGNVNVGSFSSWQSFTIQNTGNAVLNVSTRTLSGTNASEFEIDNTSPITLNPGQTFSFNARFRPSSSGSKSAIINIPSNASNNPNLTVPLSGTGVAQNTINMSVSPTSINFGNVNVGQSASQTLYISNQSSSNANLNFTAGANLTSPFTISPQGSFILSPGQSKAFTITFSPTTAGSFTQNLQIQHNATNQPNPLNVELKGSSSVPTGPGTIKIIGVIQNAHDNPTAPIGITIIARIPTSNSVLECKLHWDNLDDPGFCFEGNPQDLIHIGNNYYKISITTAFPWICGFSDGNRIKWRIYARDNQNNSYYYPQYNQPLIYDTTAVYSYYQLNSDIIIQGGPFSFVSGKLSGINSISISNNKTIYLGFKQFGNNIFPINGTYSFLRMLESKSFPWGFINQPSIEVTSLEQLGIGQNLKISFSKIGSSENYFAPIIFNTADFIASVAGIKDDLLGEKPKAYLALYEALKEIPGLIQMLNEPSFFDGTTALEQFTRILLKIAGIVSERPQFYFSLFVQKLMQIGFTRTSAEGIIRTLFKNIIPLANAYSKGEALVNAGLMLVDYTTMPWPPTKEDTLNIRRSRGHFISIEPSMLPGITGIRPMWVGTTSNFAIRVKNNSNQTLYNVWVGLDIYAYDYEQKKYIKIENTKTNFLDPETGRIGKIDFGTSQGRNIRPGQSLLYISENYTFTNSVTGFSYRSANMPYLYKFTAWSNGEPGQTSPSKAVNLLTELVAKEFYMKDQIQPNPPIIYKVVLLETDTTSQISVQTQPSEIDIKYIVFYSNGEVIDTLDYLVAKSIMISKKNYNQTITARYIDIGGLESNLSNGIVVGTVTNIEENSSVLPKEFKVLQNYPNPFNSSCVIEFHLPKNCFVKLVVYDIFGKEVGTIIKEEKKAGIHRILFNGFNNTLASGVYFYQLQTENFIQTKKMLIVR